MNCMNSARTPYCCLCMTKKEEILSRIRNDRSNIINDKTKLYGSCKCQAKFHKLTNYDNKTLRTRLTQKSQPPVPGLQKEEQYTWALSKWTHVKPTIYHNNKQRSQLINYLQKYSNSICKLVFKKPVVRKINIDWKQHSIDEVKVPHSSQWQFESANPDNLVTVRPPRFNSDLSIRTFLAYQKETPPKYQAT